MRMDESDKISQNADDGDTDLSSNSGQLAEWQRPVCSSAAVQPLGSAAEQAPAPLARLAPGASLGLSQAHIREIPAIGFGSAFGLRAPEAVWRYLPMALDAGYVHIDTGAMYGSERHVGDVLGRYMADGRLTREDFFVCTKVAHPPVERHFPEPSRGETAHMAQAKADSAAAVRRQFCGCLDRLGLGRVDLLLLHWPGPRPGEYDPAAYHAAQHNRRKRREMWAAMEELFDKKLALAIGVSNYTQRHLEELAADGARVTPHVNQVEVHPYLAQESLVQYCRDRGIVVVAYSPLGRGTNNTKKISPISDPVIANIAQARQCSPAQVVLRWLVQRGVAAVPKSATPERLAENLRATELPALSHEEMSLIGSLDQGARIYPDPEAIP